MLLTVCMAEDVHMSLCRPEVTAVLMSHGMAHSATVGNTMKSRYNYGRVPWTGYNGFA